ncbi:hypothetical protein [Sporomusa malonica]|nr:hypothetical protein [Sporomusa malonica]
MYTRPELPDDIIQELKEYLISKGINKSELDKVDLAAGGVYPI